MKNFKWKVYYRWDTEEQWTDTPHRSKPRLAEDLIEQIFEGENVRQSYLIADGNGKNIERFDMKISVVISREV